MRAIHGKLGHAPAAGHWLKSDAADIWPFQTKLDRFPEERQVLGRNGHGQRNGDVQARAKFQATPPQSPQIGAAQELLTLLLNTVTQQVDGQHTVSRSVFV